MVTFKNPKLILWILICALEVHSVSSVEPERITAEAGKTVTLPCRAPDNKTITGVLWKRGDQGSGQYVLRFIDGHNYSDDHDPSKDRVELQDGEMKDGNASLILRNVTSNDTGTYWCHVFQDPTKGRERVDKPIHEVHLDVHPSGPRKDGDGREMGERTNNGSAASAAGLTVFVVTIIVIIVIS